MTHSIDANVYRGLEAAAHTLAASHWTFLKARLFGKRSSFTSMGIVHHIATWKGKEYLLSHETLPNPSDRKES